MDWPHPGLGEDDVGGDGQHVPAVGGELVTQETAEGREVELCHILVTELLL